VRAAKARGVLTALDNTWGAGVALRGFEHGIDIVMQALTKYPSGGGDVLMGSVTTRDAALHERIKLAHMHLGLGVGANDVELVLRSLASLPLRYAAQDRPAANWPRGWPRGPKWRVCCTRRWRARPATRTGRLAARVPRGCFRCCCSRATASSRHMPFVDALRLFRIGYSWAGPMSLVVPYDLAGMRDDQARPARAPGALFHGLEAVADLQADLAQATGASSEPVGPEPRSAADFDDTLCRIRRPCSRSQSRFFSVSRLSCWALPLASAICAFTRPPL
jgi:cystathionine beta-lyase